jgi:hypothetical protein
METFASEATSFGILLKVTHCVGAWSAVGGHISLCVVLNLFYREDICTFLRAHVTSNSGFLLNLAQMMESKVDR